MAQLHLIDTRAIKQGANFSLELSIPGDTYESWIPKAQIRKNFPDIAPDILAEFTFSSLVYDGTNTHFIMSLSAIQTAAIPRTKPTSPPLSLSSTPSVLPSVPAPTVIIGTNVFLYDLEITSPNNSITIKLLDPSYVEIMGEITL